MIRLGRHCWLKRPTLTQWLWIHIQVVEYDNICEPNKTWIMQVSGAAVYGNFRPWQPYQVAGVTIPKPDWINHMSARHRCAQSVERCWQQYQPVVMEMCGNLSNFLGSADPKELRHALWRLRRHEDLSLALAQIAENFAQSWWICHRQFIGWRVSLLKPTFMGSHVFPCSVDGECVLSCVLCHWFSCLIQQK